MAGQFPGARGSTQGRASNVLARLPPLNLRRLTGRFNLEIIGQSIALKVPYDPMTNGYFLFYCNKNANLKQ